MWAPETVFAPDPRELLSKRELKPWICGDEISVFLSNPSRINIFCRALTRANPLGNPADGFFIRSLDRKLKGRTASNYHQHQVIARVELVMMFCDSIDLAIPKPELCDRGEIRKSAWTIRIDELRIFLW